MQFIRFETSIRVIARELRVYRHAKTYFYFQINLEASPKNTIFVIFKKTKYKEKYNRTNVIHFLRHTLFRNDNFQFVFALKRKFYFRLLP
jgi:hypothetical protein